MKGTKCKSTIFSSSLLRCAFLAVFCALFLPLLCGSKSVSAASFSGSASHWWAGFSNIQAPFADGYDIEFTWYPVGEYVDSNKSFTPSLNLIDRFLVKNISLVSPAEIRITSSMYSTGSLNFSGWVDIILGVDNTYVNSSYAIKQLDTSVYKLFDGGAFSVGLSANTGVYDADVVNVVMVQNLSTLYADSQRSVISYRVSFTARYNNWTRGNGYQRLNWRLNGNSNTNGGRGNMFAPFVYSISGIPTSLETLQLIGPRLTGSTGNQYNITISENGTTPTIPPTSSAPDYSDLLNNINSSLDSLGSQNTTIIGQNQQIINNQKETTDAIKNQTEQQKEQYEQDKKEEADRENNLSGDSDKILGLFSFNLLNPFAAIFTLFSDGSSCAQIPTLSRWLHTKDTQICPWFPTEVRTVLTPVLGIASTMILFGFVVHWFNRMQEVDL